VGNQEGDLSAFNAATGSLVWRYELPRRTATWQSKNIEGTPTVSTANNAVYFGASDGYLYELNATTGALDCSFNTVSDGYDGGHIASSALVENGVDVNGVATDVAYFGDNGQSGAVVTGGNGGNEWAVNVTPGAQNCSLIWRIGPFPLGMVPSGQLGSGSYNSPGSATLPNGTNVVIFGTTDPDDAVYAVNASTGAVVWRFQTAVGTDTDVGAAPTISAPGVNGFADGVVYETGKDGDVYALNLVTGTAYWSYVLPGNHPSQSAAALVGNTIYEGYGATTGGEIALNATTGAVIWNNTSVPANISSPAVSGAAGDQVLLLGDLAGAATSNPTPSALWGLSLSSGAVVFHNVPDPSDSTSAFFASPAVSTGRVFITSTDGNLYAFGVGNSNAAPTVTSVDANQGALGASNLVTVTGTAFNSVSDVVFGATDIPSSNAYPCSGASGGCFSVINPTEIKAYTPTSLGAGTFDVTVVTPGGSSPITSADHYTSVSPGVYTAVAPFRTCDTRSGSPTPACAGKTLGVRGEINVQITGVGGVPAGAKAVVVNLTAINDTTTPTFVSAFPTGEAVPTVSNINLAAGQVDANLAIVQLSSSGQMTVYNSVGRADVIVDVQGYFAAPGGSPVAGEFHTMPPLRICDSRADMNTECAGSVNDPIQAGTWRRVVLSGLPPGAAGGTPSIPTTGAAAAVFNLTATGGSASTYLAVAAPNSSDACPTTVPKFSNLNPSAGIALPNRVISTLGPHQDVCVFNSVGSINFVIDVNGWFGNGHESAAGALFYSVPPTRICDTRIGSGDECDSESLSGGEIQPIPVAGVDVVPAEGGSAAPVAVVANLTGVAGSANTVFTLFPSDAPQPRASDLNPSAGQVIANLAIVGIATTGAEIGDVSLFNDVGNINAILDVAGWFQ
jgi:outer membrane protein assembly factor BamB